MIPDRFQRLKSANLAIPTVYRAAGDALTPFFLAQKSSFAIMERCSRIHSGVLRARRISSSPKSLSRPDPLPERFPSIPRPEVEPILSMGFAEASDSCRLI